MRTRTAARIRALSPWQSERRWLAPEQECGRAGTLDDKLSPAEQAPTETNPPRGVIPGFQLLTVPSDSPECHRMLRFLSTVVIAMMLCCCYSNSGVKTRIPELAQLMRENEAAAYAKYHRRRVEISGVIREVGVEAAERVRATYSGVASTTPGENSATASLTGESTAHLELVQLPRILLTEGERRDSSVLCYFRSVWMEDVSALREGDTVTVTGKLYDHTKGPHCRVVLTQCELR